MSIPLALRCATCAWLLTAVAASPCLGAVADSSFQSRPISWTLLPILFSSPDTGFGFGVLPQFVYRSRPDVRASSARLEAYYTQESQFNIALTSQVWLAANRRMVGGRLRLRSWPTTYYTPGNEPGEAVNEPYRERSAQLSLEARERLRPGIYAGAKYDLRRFTIDRMELGGLLAGGAVRGGGDGTIGGLGVELAYDTRDAVFAPQRGALLAVSTTLYRPIFLSDYACMKYEIDARKYFLPFPNQVLALQVVLRSTTGAAPFQLLSGVGEVLRGFKSVSMNDRHLLAFQAAYRVVPVWWRVGFEVFAGAGQTAPTISRFSAGRLHGAVGAGLRFQVMQLERVHVRWDFGFSKEGMRDYIDIDEAF